jgi:predicted GIY-YIG superfamily endonuclease
MKKPSDYTKGLIYKICCNDENIKDIYIGSTVDFKRRKGRHKCNCYNEKTTEYNCKLYKYIRDNGGWSNWTMIELYKYPCNNKRELIQEEDKMMIELNSTLNNKRACRNPTEYRYDNRETINKKNAEYRAKNRETLNMKGREKIKCINCGCITSRNYMTEHVKTNKCISYNKPL